MSGGMVPRGRRWAGHGILGPARRRVPL